jgi:hypothetical protein
MQLTVRCCCRAHMPQFPSGRAPCLSPLVQPCQRSGGSVHAYAKKLCVDAAAAAAAAAALTE